MNQTADQLLATLQARDLPVPGKLLRQAWERIVPLYQAEEIGAVSRLEFVCGVLEELCAYDPDQALALACLLQFLPDAKDPAARDLAAFGAETAALVPAIHRLHRIQASGQRLPIGQLRAAYFNLAVDPRAVLVTLCEKLWILKHLSLLSPSRQAPFAREALKVYAPVAARLGIYGLKHQLEALAFPIAYPTDSERIAAQLGRLKQRYGDFLGGVGAELAAALRKQDLQVRVEARAKQPYSIFAKMREKGMGDIEDVYDLFALRIIVPEITDCYRALGCLHQLGHSVPNRFKDYITLPKPNGYQSLHTALTHLPGVPAGVLVEVQIRTAAMHREAELGVAAHWTYKEGAAPRPGRRVRQPDDAGAGDEMESDGHDRIFVLTPRGDVVELPLAATPLDFAFSVHTQLGLSYKGAKVNGQIVPMEHPLENGDVVEIIRANEPHPSARWMPLLKTAAARTRLRKALAERNRESYLERGREALNVALKGRRLAQLDADLSLLASIKGESAGREARQDFLVKLGQGQLKLAAALGAIDALAKTLAVASASGSKPAANAVWTVRLDTDVRLTHRFARCCKPDARKVRDAIVGVVSQQRVVVHREACKAIKTVAQTRRIPAEWVRAEAPAVSRGTKR